MRYIFCFIIALTLLSNSTDALAQTMTENISLSFGKIILTDNSSSKQIALITDGSYTADPDYIFFSEPRLGNITVDGYTPFTPLMVSIGSTALQRVGGGADFTLDGAYTVPALIITDATGTANFDVGAVLSSDGSGNNLIDDTYEGDYSVSISITP